MKEITVCLCEYLAKIGYRAVISNGEVVGFFKNNVEVIGFFKNKGVGIINRIYCYLNACVHNHDRRCSESIISIGNKTSNEFCCGERVCYAVCEDYEELEKDE